MWYDRASRQADHRLGADTDQAATDAGLPCIHKKLIPRVLGLKAPHPIGLSPVWKCQVNLQPLFVHQLPSEGLLSFLCSCGQIKALLVISFKLYLLLDSILQPHN